MEMVPLGKMSAQPWDFLNIPKGIRVCKEVEDQALGIAIEEIRTAEKHFP